MRRTARAPINLKVSRLHAFGEPAAAPRLLNGASLRSRWPGATSDTAQTANSSTFQTDRRSSHSLALAVGIATAIGCGPRPAPPNPLCDNQEALAINEDCDILEPDCQKAVFEATRCVRGGTGALPPVRVISEAQYDEDLRDDGETNDAGMQDAGMEDVALDHWGESLRMLGLLEPEKDRSEAFIDEASSRVAAYYSSYYREITIVDRMGDFDDADAMNTLSHEYIHALQDTDYGLGERRNLYSNNDDNIIALTNLTEGEASMRAELAYGVLMSIPPDGLHLEDHFTRRLSRYQGYLAAHPSPYIAARAAMHYATGPRYFAQVFSEHGSAGIDALMTSFPLTSVEWMAGYDARHEYASEQPLHCRGHEAPDGYSIRFRDVLGAVVLFAFLSSERMGGFYDIAGAWNLALQWRAEQLYIFVHEETDLSALTWHVRFATVADATAFSRAATQMEPGWVLVQDGPEIRLFAATDQEILTAWIDNAPCEPQRDDE